MELALWVAEPFSCIFSFPFGCFGENFHPFQLQFFIFCTEIYSLLGLAKLKDMLHFKLLTRTWKTDFVSRQRNGTWTPSILKEEERTNVNTQHQIILKTGGAGARCPTPTAWLPGTRLPPSASGQAAAPQLPGKQCLPACHSLVPTLCYTRSLTSLLTQLPPPGFSSWGTPIYMSHHD